MDLEDGEEPTFSSYAMFKSHNEIDPENIDKFAPKYPEIDSMDETIKFG